MANRQDGSFIPTVFDVLIAGGQIIDGSGNVGFPGAIGVDGDSVQILRGDVANIEARRRIDATGRVVCPGFIDFHAHSGLVILADWPFSGLWVLGLFLGVDLVVNGIMPRK